MKFRWKLKALKGDPWSYIDINEKWAKLSSKQIIRKILWNATPERYESKQIDETIKNLSNLFLEDDEKDESVSIHWQQYNHKKFQRITDSMKLEIVSEIIKWSKSISQVAKKYFITYSTVYRIMTQFKNFQYSSAKWF